jgi:thiamine biosynthesis protein ThiC
LNGRQALDPVACWALVYDETEKRDRVIGMIDHDGLILVEYAKDQKVEFQYYANWDELDEEERASLLTSPFKSE